ncbi:hypothetical protein Aglo01_36390 [Actinokineospora globicatena]|nr:hypothetical protein Aglo01_36390 [Actinokineospora globicatena]
MSPPVNLDDADRRGGGVGDGRPDCDTPVGERQGTGDQAENVHGVNRTVDRFGSTVQVPGMNSWSVRLPTVYGVDRYRDSESGVGLPAARAFRMREPGLAGRGNHSVGGGQPQGETGTLSARGQGSARKR